MSRDPKVLSQLEMNQTAPTFKVKENLSVYVLKKVVECNSFSINIDECTSDNRQKVFNIIVSYCDPEIGESVVQHY